MVNKNNNKKEELTTLISTSTPIATAKGGKLGISTRLRQPRYTSTDTCMNVCTQCTFVTQRGSKVEYEHTVAYKHHISLSANDDGV